jgi:acetolactate synthase-1/3 small subunit
VTVDRHILSILVENQSGVLSRITGLFSRRGYNISSLSVGVTENEDVSRITIVVYCDNSEIEQIMKQVEKLVDVIRVIELNKEKGVFRELAIIKVSAIPEKRAEIFGMIDAFRASVIDVGTESLTIEMTGEQEKIAAFTNLMEPYGIKEIVRTGLTGVCRGNNPIKHERP